MGAERDHATHDKSVAETVPERGPAPIVGADRVLALQRTAGNRAATRILARDKDSKASNDRKFEVEVPLGVHGKLRFGLKTTGVAIAEGSSGPVTGKAGASEFKAAYTWGEGFAATLTSKLVATEIGTSPFEWLKVKVKVDALKAKLDLRKPKTSVSALEVAIELEAPSLPDDFLTALDAELGGKLTGVSLVGEYRYPVDVDDLWNLYKWASASEDLTKSVEEIGRRSEQLKDLRAKQAELEARLKREFPDGKRPSGGSRRAVAARNRFDQQARALREERRKLGRQIASLSDDIGDAQHLLGKANRVLQATERKIKGAAGRVAVKAFGEAGLKALKEIGEKFTPIAGAVATANDIYELGEKVANIGDVIIGLDGGDEPGSSGDGQGEGGTEETGSTEPGDGGAAETDAVEGGEPGEGEYERPQGLSANGQAVFDALVPRSRQPGVDWKPEDWAAVDGLVAGLGEEQVAAVLEGISELKAGEGTQLQTMDQLFGTILLLVERAQTTREPPADTAEAQRMNEIEQRVIGFDPQQVTGRAIEAGSREFAQWTKAYQQERGLKADGVFGPVTAGRWYEEHEMADAPAAKRARAERKRRRREPEAGGGERSPDAKLLDDPLHYLTADKAGARLVGNAAAIAKAVKRHVKLSTGLEVEIRDVEVTDADEGAQKIALVALTLEVTAVADGEAQLKVGDVRARRWSVAYDAPDGPKEIFEVLAEI